MLKIIKKLFSKNVQVAQYETLKEKFSEVYAHNIFGGRKSRSGEGSDLVQTAVIRQAIPELVRELGIKTYMDAPCGDWYWMKEVSLGVEKYIGVDIVEPMIAKLAREYGNETRSFFCRNLAEDELPQVDMILCRDCLVHLSFEDARKVLANFKRSKSKYLLTTTFTERAHNNDLVGADAFWRPINLELAPFNFPHPLRLINEKCTEENNQFTDKYLGLWLLEDIQI